MAFEDFSIIAEITTEDGAQYALISAFTAVAAWFGLNIIKPWFSDWLQERKLDREAERKRHDAIAQAQIDEIKQRAIDRKEDNDRKAEADNKLLDGLVRQGKDEQAHMNLLTAQGQAQAQIIDELRKIRSDFEEGFNMCESGFHDIYNRLGVERDERFKAIRPAATDGKPTSA